MSVSETKLVRSMSSSYDVSGRLLGSWRMSTHVISQFLSVLLESLKTAIVAADIPAVIESTNAYGGRLEMGLRAVVAQLFDDACKFHTIFNWPISQSSQWLFIQFRVAENPIMITS